MLTVSHLRKEFSTVLAVDDVSFTVSRGEVYGLIGPNGAGKSTTIRMIMNVIQPDSGDIRIDGQPPSPAFMNLTGYLPEERGLYKKNRLRDVIAYFAALKGITRRDALTAAMPWLERFGLEARLDGMIEELSKGNQQKVQFIITLLHQPSLLVLDELFSGLDPVNQSLMKDALMELKADNRAIIFSTHQMDHAERLCDELMMIDRGRTVLDGSPAEIKRRHGRNAVHVSFTGDGAFLGTLPGVRRADVSANFAELELDGSPDGNALLAQLLPRVQVHSFARVEPSLHAIFLDIVGRRDDSGGADDEAPVTVPAAAVSRDPAVRKAVLQLLVFILAFIGTGAQAIADPGTPIVAVTALFAAAIAVSFVRLRAARARARAALSAAHVPAQTGTEGGAR